MTESTSADRLVETMTYFAAAWAACMNSDDFERAADYVSKMKGLCNFAAVVTAHTRERKAS